MEDNKLLCYGCGIELQSEDATKDGYVDPKALCREVILCKRCYQLQHYGKFVKSDSVKNTIQLLFDSAQKQDLIVLIVDCALAITPLIKELNKLNCYENLLVVANRYDLYREYLSKEKLYSFLQRELDSSKLKPIDILVIDNNIDFIFDRIDALSAGKDTYLVGLENAGKTTFINAILKQVAKEEKVFLTNSKYPGTTVDLVRIPFTDETALVDSPGIRSAGNIANFLSLNTIKLINSEKRVNPVTYQLNPNQSIAISNIIRFDFLDGMKHGISFFFPPIMEVNRFNLENADKSFKNVSYYLKVKENEVHGIKDLTPHTIVISKNEYHDIVIEGLGFLRVKRGRYVVYTFKGVNVFARKSMM